MTPLPFCHADSYVTQFATVVILLTAGLCAPLATAQEKDASPWVREWTEWSYEGPSNSKARVAAAHDAKDEVVEALFAEAGVAFPPRVLLFRVIKDEDLLEVWAADSLDAAATHVTSYAICSASGGPGPKRRQGDGQVPEGFYTIDLYNNHSSFYLSMRIGYPNQSDRILGGRNPGSAIMIHGNCVSIGCLAMTDERMQEIWVMAEAMRNARRKVHVHLFPGRDIDGYLAAEGNVDRKAFWSNIKEGYEWFEERRTLPRIAIDSDGRYHFSERPKR